MIFFNNISLSFAARTIFDNILWTVTEKSRIGLVGDNGTGKTTLLRVVMGIVELDSGSVEIAGRKNRTIGYLPQDLTELDDMPLIDYLKKMSGVAALEENIRRYETDISAAAGSRAEADNGLLRAYEGALNEFSARGGYSFEARARQVLNGMGFRQTDAARRCSEFSGGWKMRALLAAILVSNPDIMLLDEPTNHLDTESMEWLESWLKDYQGTIIAVAHDRVFLDKITTQTAELSGNSITIYKGNYSYYLKEKERRLEALRKEAALQRSEIKRTQEFVERFRFKATKARQVQSRLKMLERYEVIQEQDSAKAVKIKFPDCPKSGREVASVRGLGMAYGAQAVFQGLEFNIHRGEKIALVGVNGAGKSTLARIMGLVESPSSGAVKYGLNVRMAYFSQESSQNLNYNKTVWEDVSGMGAGGNDQDRRNLLGAFLFSGDDIHKPVSVLSGGEKSRLALLKILLQDSNFLVLDEPTNHLDLRTKDIFQSALLSYGGTLLIVSHDRHFLDRLVGRVIEIRDGKIFDYSGNYSYFIEKRRAASEQTAPAGSAPEDIVQKKSPGYKTREEKRSEAEARNRLAKLKKPLVDELRAVEERIVRLEQEKKINEELICRPAVATDHQKLRALSLDLKSVEDDLAQLYSRWDELSEKLESITEP